MKQMQVEFEKCKAVTLSCKTLPQINTAINMNTAFIKKWRSKKKDLEELFVYTDQLASLQKKRMEVINNYGKTLEGERCIAVSNQDEDVSVGTVDSFYDWDKTDQSFLPMVKFDNDDKIYLCMGILLPYHEETVNWLNSFPNGKERWNAVCRPHAKII